jgi:dipeptidyl aminopeptidase/acylaminoacyl peptidase
MRAQRAASILHSLVAITFVILVAVDATVAQQPIFNKQRVTYLDGQLTLVGFVYKPNGPGPFPTVVWNHGSEKDPGSQRQFDSVAEIFVPSGYAVFAPTRRGHGASEGVYIDDAVNALRQKGDMDGAARLMVRLLETEQLDDQFAGIAYAKKLPFVDTSRMAVAGCSFGGIQTLLAAERGGGFKAAFPISPAALTWDKNPEIRRRLIAAVKKITIPVLLIQPPKDPSLEPALVLGQEAKKMGKTSFTTKVYPSTMPDSEQGHCFGGAKGMHNWAAEALAFFNEVLGHR